MADARQVRYTSLVLAAVLLLIFVVERLFLPLDLFMFVAADALERPWTMVTSVFVHSDYMHLLNNLFFLAVFGFIMENTVGTKKFLIAFAAAGLFANLAAFTFYPTTPTLGASGAISGVIAALAVIRPRAVGLFWGAPVPMWVALIGWIATNLIGFAGTGGNIAYEAHLYGLVVGIAYGLYIRRTHSFGRNDDDRDDEIDIDVEAWEREYMR